MLSARTIYGEIFDNDEAFGLFCSIAASGEAQGGWENGKIAALVPGSQAGLAAKIARHGADQPPPIDVFPLPPIHRGCAVLRYSTLAKPAHESEWRAPRDFRMECASISDCDRHKRATQNIEVYGGWSIRM